MTHRAFVKSNIGTLEFGALACAVFAAGTVALALGPGGFLDGESAHLEAFFAVLPWGLIPLSAVAALLAVGGDKPYWAALRLCLLGLVATLPLVAVGLWLGSAAIGPTILACVAAALLVAGLVGVHVAAALAASARLPAVVVVGVLCAGVFVLGFPRVQSAMATALGPDAALWIASISPLAAYLRLCAGNLEASALVQLCAFGVAAGVLLHLAKQSKRG